MKHLLVLIILFSSPLSSFAYDGGGGASHVICNYNNTVVNCEDLPELQAQEEIQKQNETQKVKEEQETKGFILMGFILVLFVLSFLYHLYREHKKMILQ